MARSRVDHTANIVAQAERMERDLSAIRRALRKPLAAEVARGALTPPQTAVMRIVVRKPGISLKDLSREVSLAHSTVSGIVDRLEKRGMIERTPDAADRRILRIHPASVVTSWIEEQLPLLKLGPLQAALQRAKPAERKNLERALTRLRELLTVA